MDRLVWAASDTFRTPRGPVRLRANSAGAAALVRAALAAHLVDDDTDAPFDLGVRLEPGGAGPAPLHVVYAGCDVILRSRDPARALRVLVAHALEPTSSGSGEGATVAVGPRGAALLPPSARARLAVLERRLNAAGVRVADQPSPHLDTKTGEVIVVEPPSVHEAGVAALGLPARAELGPASPGRYPIAGSILDWPSDDELLRAIVDLIA